MRHRALSLAALVAAVLLLGGCGGSEDSGGSSDMCAQRDEIVATAEDFTELDASETSADELRSRATDFRDRLENKVARAEDALKELSEKWARVPALVTDRCNQQ